MEMTYDGALVMPSSYAVMDEEEMTYVEGGDWSGPCNRNYLSKTTCNVTAKYLVGMGIVKGMSSDEVAKEIFAHAYCYYNYSDVAKHFGSTIATYCYNKAADGIYIADGGDTWVRKAAYNSFWAFFPG